jgi:hypothetical protein
MEESLKIMAGETVSNIHGLAWKSVDAFALLFALSAF